MFTIRKKQMRAFDLVQPSRFRAKMLPHLATYFPEKASLLGERVLLQIIDNALNELPKFKILTYYDGCLFVELNIDLGCGFASDNAYIELQEYLLVNKDLDASKVMEHAMTFCTKYKASILKKDELFPSALVDKIKNTKDEDFEDFLKIQNVEGVHALFESLWPEKYKFTPTEQWTKLIQTGTTIAKEFGFSSAEGINLFLLLQFTLGHRFYIDPQYFWFSTILNNPEYADDYYKYCSLYFTLQKYFEALLEKEPITL